MSAGENPGLFLYSGPIGRESAFLRKIPFRSTKPVNARKRHKPGKHSVYAAFGDIEEIEVEGRKRTYSLTDKGREAFHEELARLRACVNDGEEALS